MIEKIISVFKGQASGYGIVPGHATSVRSSRPEVFLGKGILKICNKFTEEQPCQNLISIKLQSNCIEITLPHGCSPLH